MVDPSNCEVFGYSIFLTRARRHTRQGRGPRKGRRRSGMTSMTVARGGPATTSGCRPTSRPVRARPVAVRTVSRRTRLERPDSGRLPGLAGRRRAERNPRRGPGSVATRASDSGGDLDVDDDRLEARGVPDAFTSGSAASSSESRFVQKGFDAGRRARPLGGFDGDDDDDESDAPIARRPRVKPDAAAAANGADGEFPAWEPKFPSSLDDLGERWRSMPSRYRILLGTCCAFVLCNMDKVNISVAIIPMAKDMGCLLYTSPSPRDATLSRMPSSA